MSALVPLLLAAAASQDLENARLHLDQGEIDEALVLLEGRTFPEDEHAAAAEVMAEAGLEALRADDYVLALHFAQMARRHHEDEPLAAEVAARASFAMEQFAAAERYAARWLELSGRDPGARMLLAELAFAQGQWQRVLDHTATVRAAELVPAQALRLDFIRTESRTEIQQHRSGRLALEAVEAELKQQRQRRRHVPASKPWFPPERPRRRSCGR